MKFTPDMITLMDKWRHTGFYHIAKAGTPHAGADRFLFSKLMHFRDIGGRSIVDIAPAIGHTGFT